MTPTFGLAVPHYEGLVPGRVSRNSSSVDALTFTREAEGLGFDRAWVSDHLSLNLDGGYIASGDCWTLLGAAAAATTTIRLGSLVSNVPLRNAKLLLHQIATVIDLAGPRIDVGLGAGWDATEFTAIGTSMPAASRRLALLENASTDVRKAFGAPVWIGGKRPRLLEVAGRRADTWNLSWDPTLEQFSKAHTLVRAAAASAGRSPDSIGCSVGLTVVVADTERQLHREWTRLCDWVPGRYLDQFSFEQWRSRGLIGTHDEVIRRIDGWCKAGVNDFVTAFGMPYGVYDSEQLSQFSTLMAEVRTASAASS